MQRWIAYQTDLQKISTQTKLEMLCIGPSLLEIRLGSILSSLALHLGPSQDLAWGFFANVAVQLMSIQFYAPVVSFPCVLLFCPWLGLVMTVRLPVTHWELIHICQKPLLMCLQPHLGICGRLVAASLGLGPRETRKSWSVATVSTLICSSSY